MSRRQHRVGPAQGAAGRSAHAADGWARVGRRAGVVAGVALLLQTVLFLLDVTGVLVPRVVYRTTARGVQQDLIDYYVAVNERMHLLWWDVAARDVAGPVGYLALMVLIAASVRVVGTDRPRPRLGGAATLIGAGAAALSDLMFLSHLTWWRPGGFQPTADIVAFGRAGEVMDSVGSTLQTFGHVMLAVGLVALAPTVAAVDRRLGWLAYAQAALLAVVVLARIVGADPIALAGSIASGLVVSPALAVLLGLALGRRGGRTRGPADPG